jgi:hypothetical protein
VPTISENLPQGGHNSLVPMEEITIMVDYHLQEQNKKLNEINQNLNGIRAREINPVRI